MFGLLYSFFITTYEKKCLHDVTMDIFSTTNNSDLEENSSAIQRQTFDNIAEYTSEGESLADSVKFFVFFKFIYLFINPPFPILYIAISAPL